MRGGFFTNFATPAHGGPWHFQISRCRKNSKTDWKIAMTFSMYFSNQHAIKNEWVKWQKFGSIISIVITIFIKFYKYIYRGWMRNNNNSFVSTSLISFGPKRGFTFCPVFHKVLVYKSKKIPHMKAWILCFFEPKLKGRGITKEAPHPLSVKTF